MSGGKSCLVAAHPGAQGRQETVTAPFDVLGRGEPVVRKRSAEEQGSKPDCRTLRGEHWKTGTQELGETWREGKRTP